ncbi:c-type cytochrome biogenesis protein CcmI [Phenylobacterium immobile]|uniref:c-type cytochrome biogenesis protein CcmI n=1 Tax=Phenylobacterium immobile TaxID=21 RepID=UPI000AB7F004|nr:c-type cytochrome biogenesis protein CcmI [Phenylobacterium immobile]
MLLFWAVAGLLAAGAAGLILFRAGRVLAVGEAADPATGLYQRQIAEIDDLAERGLIPPAERTIAQAEAGRRLLRESDRHEAAWTTGGRGGVVVVAALAPALALGLYLLVGAPGVSDQPFAKRLAGWAASAPETLAPDALAAVMRQVVRGRPNDPEALRILAIAEGAQGDAPAAVRAMRRAVQAAPARADLWEMLGEAMLMQAGGEMTPPTEVVFQQALKRDPALPAARFHLARGRAAAGDKAAATAGFQGLLRDLPADDPRRATVQAALAEVEAGPAPLDGATLDLVRGMVASLEGRLAAEPRNADGWVRLVRAYAVLGETAKRDAALKRARALFPGQPEVEADLVAASKAEALK